MDLTGWTPTRLDRDGVEWVYTGELRFVDPFFEQTLDTAVRDPFSLLFQARTPLETLLDWQERSPGLGPAGFVFHVSRCGSTLVTQMLATATRLRVLSEPRAVDAVLRADLPRRQRARLLRALVSALGQPLPGEEQLVLKLDSWSVLELDLVEEAFPGVPWLFLYRDPLEVLVSQLGHAGAHAVPGALPPRLFGLDWPHLASKSREEYVAHVLARICEGALAHAESSSGCFVDYRRLPEFVLDELPARFGLRLTKEERGRMREVGRLDAKNPSLPFEPDSERKRAAASTETERLAGTMLAPLYDRLCAC